MPSSGGMLRCLDYMGAWNFEENIGGNIFEGETTSDWQERGPRFWMSPTGLGLDHSYGVGPSFAQSYVCREWLKRFRVKIKSRVFNFE